MKKRIFIAIELTKEIKQNLIEVQQDFKELKAKLVKSEHMHLTMIFLGDIDEAKISEIEGVCEGAAKKFRPFEIEFIGIGAFPNPRRSHVLWVGIKDSEKLIRLQKELALGLRKVGFHVEDRSFVPHLTLARLKKRSNLKTQIVRFDKVNFGKMKVENFNIFESELSPEGPKHRVIKNLKFKAQSSNIK